MYAIFETGGKQYKVAAGDVLRIEKIDGDAGKKIKFENVLAFSDGNGALQTGTPYLDAVTVNATVLASGKSKKIIIFKFKSKKDYRKKQGHRQPFTEIEIDNFNVGGKTVGEKPVAEEAPEAEDVSAGEEPAAAEKPPAKERAAVKEKKPAKPKAPKADKEEPVEAEKPPAEETTIVKEKKPARPKASKEDPIAKENAAIEKKPAKPKTPKPEKAAVEEEKPEVKDEEKTAAKQTKADIMAKLDKIGVEYSKSLKKDELLELLDKAEKK